MSFSEISSGADSSLYDDIDEVVYYETLALGFSDEEALQIAA